MCVPIDPGLVCSLADFCFHSASQPHNNLICTQGGNLPCRNIIHLVHNDDIKKQVSQTLKECEQRQFTSVAFPAIGTGLYHLVKNSVSRKNHSESSSNNNVVRLTSCCIIILSSK